MLREGKELAQSHTAKKQSGESVCQGSGPSAVLPPRKRCSPPQIQTRRLRFKVTSQE